jgi:dTDP-4-dehydrorhamnose reductase
MMTSANQKVLLLGATGMLGATLAPLIATRGYEVVIHGRVDASASYRADLNSIDATCALLELINPDVIVNLVGLTDVDRCEAQPNDAYLANVRTVEHITNWLRQHKEACHFVHISTDQVYDGPGLHAERNVTLKNYYAFSKYAGELAAIGVPSTILRTNFFGRSHCVRRSSLTDWLFRALSNGESIQVFDDVHFSPLTMNTLSMVIERVIQQKPIGVFNVGSHDGMSKADFAFTFAKVNGLPTGKMTRTTTDKVTFLKTYRPKDMRMDCTKFENAIGIKLPALKDEIERTVKEYIC